MTNYCIDICGDTEESNIRRHNVPFNQLVENVAEMLGQYHKATGGDDNPDADKEQARDLLAECLIGAADREENPDADHPMSAADGLIEIWEEPEPASFGYLGSHFVPVRQWKDDDEVDRAFRQCRLTEWSRQITQNYNHEDFYRNPMAGDYDIFLRIEDGRYYTPCEHTFYDVTDAIGATAQQPRNHYVSTYNMDFGLNGEYESRLEIPENQLAETVADMISERFHIDDSSDAETFVEWAAGRLLGEAFDGRIPQQGECASAGHGMLRILRKN